MNTRFRILFLAFFSPFCVTAQAQVPQLINYQGRVAVGGVNFDSVTAGHDGLFKFALIDGGTNPSVQATATATRSGSFITAITVTNGGIGYSTVPTVTITGGGGSGATATANLSNGTVSSITVNTAGTGYTSTPSVAITAPPATYSNSFWSNDGTSVIGGAPTASVALTVTKGLYSVLLGTTNGIPASVFSNANVRLRVWFNDGTNGFQLLSPDQRIAAVGYALVAETVPDGAIGSSKLANNLTLPGTTSGSFSGNGSALTSLNAANLTGSVPSGSLSAVPAASLTGTISDPRLSTNVALRNATNNFTGTQTVNGNVGIMTTNPTLAPLVVDGQVNLNTAVMGDSYPVAFSQSWPVVHFNSYYSGSGGINKIFTGGGASPSYAGQISLNPGTGSMQFYTTTGSTASNADVTSTIRMTLLNNGNVGIGTQSPGGKLDVDTGVGRVQFRNEGGLTPGINLTGGSFPGILRLRNSLEVWPNDALTAAGRIDVRDTTNAATIALDGATGKITAKNMPAVKSSQHKRDPRTPVDDITIDVGANAVLDSITLNIPSDGFLIFTATANCTFSASTDGIYFKLEDATSASPSSLVEVAAILYPDADLNPVLVRYWQTTVLKLSWTEPVNAGTRTYRTGLFNNTDPDFDGSPVRIDTTTLNAIFIPNSL